MELEQLVVFAILMQTGDGIMTKTPRYILEKAELCALSKTRDPLRGLLDMQNCALYDAWIEEWLTPRGVSAERG